MNCADMDSMGEDMEMTTQIQPIIPPLAIGDHPRREKGGRYKQTEESHGEVFYNMVSEILRGDKEAKCSIRLSQSSPVISSASLLCALLSEKS